MSQDVRIVNAVDLQGLSHYKSEPIQLFHLLVLRARFKIRKSKEEAVANRLMKLQLNVISMECATILTTVCMHIHK
jgi:hypothetical protein